MSKTQERERLDGILQRRDELRQNVERLKGRLEAAQAELESIKGEARDKGVDPDQLEATIEALRIRFKEAVDELAVRIQESEETLAPFLGP